MIKYPESIAKAPTVYGSVGVSFLDLSFNIKGKFIVKRAPFNNGA